MMDKDEQRLFSERGERLAEYRDALAAKDARIKELEETILRYHPNDEEIYRRMELAEAELAQVILQRDTANQALTQLIGVLDIIQREAEGEDAASLASDYGGTGWEQHPACVAVRKYVDTLLAEAVWAMQEHKHKRLEVWADIFDSDGSDEHTKEQLRIDPIYQRAQAFLSRPDVREWQERQKETKA